MPEITASAPGRVNLIGEHTDYQDGFVMPTAVPQRTTAVLRTRTDQRVHASSRQAEGEDFTFEPGSERRGGGWADYVQGVTWALATRGFDVGGFDLCIDSDVPLGSGLSSSAALEVATLRAIREAFALGFDDVTLARIAQQAEVEFVGAPVGIMDQMACSLAGEREALFLDTRSLRFERIPLPAALELAVIDSGIAHRHAGGDYVTRRRESEEAARLLGVPRLRDVPAADMPRIAALPPVLARRARHIVSENARVLEARERLLAADLQAFGRLLDASHASLRDDYEVSDPAVDALVEITQSEDGVFGARMTGGGFGGAIVAAVAAGRAADAAARIAVRYSARGFARPAILLPRVS
jgi:galactokinase